MSSRLPLVVSMLLLAGCDAHVAPPTAGASFTFEAQSTYDAGDGPASPTAIARHPSAEASPGAQATPPIAGDGPAGPAGPAAVTGLVRDEFGMPVAQAVVTLADGRRATTNDAGHYTLSGPFPAGALMVAKPGYATSVVLGLDAGQTVHLRKADGQRDLTGQRTTKVTGSVLWPSGDHAGGAVYYVDTLQSRATQAMVVGDGFTLDVTAPGTGEPRGVIMVLAATRDNQQAYIGVSRPFAPFAGGSPGQVPMHLASEALTYRAGAVPAETNRLASQLEILQPGAPPLVLFGAETASGTFPVPPPGKLPGALRVTVEAQDALATWRTRLSMTPVNGSASGDFLRVPAPVVEAGARRVSWAAIAGAEGYRLEVRNQARPHPMWEAWTPDAQPLTLSEEAWPTREDEFLLEAIADAQLDSRRVAALGPRSLRVEPWAEAPSHRVASRRFQVR